MFQTGSVQRNAFQLGGSAGPSAAFQQGAFQGGAFQLYSGYQNNPVPDDARRPGGWYPEERKRRRPERPIIYVDENGNPVELGQKPAKIEPLSKPLKPAAKAEIPLDLLASELAEGVQAQAAAYMRRVQDEYDRFLIIQQMEAIAAEEALNAALIRAIIKDVVARQMDDEEAFLLMAALA